MSIIITEYEIPPANFTKNGSPGQKYQVYVQVSGVHELELYRIWLKQKHSCQYIWLRYKYK